MPTAYDRMYDECNMACLLHRDYLNVLNDLRYYQNHRDLLKDPGSYHPTLEQLEDRAQYYEQRIARSEYRQWCMKLEIETKVFNKLNLKVGDRIKVYQTRNPYYLNGLMFVITIDTIDNNIYSSPVYSGASDNGERHAVWKSSLFRIVKD